jgi:hypothetical protein
MVEYNINNSIMIKFIFSNLHCEVPKYMWQKNVHHYVLENANILKND